ncbi:hypothetical protein M3Y99_00949900 [Aphelenchoides fujianensis]|nr:hypothetical protein M3Y99_00949900 [Aphelenchoides fujianensis]
MLANGTIFAFDGQKDGATLMTKCGQSLDLHFWIDGYEFAVELVLEDDEGAVCPVFLHSSNDFAPRRYTDLPQFQFGFSVLQSLCIAFDHSIDAMTLGTFVEE